MEINGDVTMETTNRKVKIGLVSKSTKDCWTPDFRNIIPHIYGLHIYLGTECQLPPVFHFCTENSETLST